MPAGVANRNDGFLSAALRTAAEYLAGGDPAPAHAVPMPRPRMPPPRPQLQQQRLQPPPAAPGPVRSRQYRASHISGYVIWLGLVERAGILTAMGVPGPHRLRALGMLWRALPGSEKERVAAYACELNDRIRHSERLFRSIGTLSAADERQLRAGRRASLAHFLDTTFAENGAPNVHVTDELQERLSELDNPAPAPPPPPPPPALQRGDDTEYIPLGAHNHPDNPFLLERTPPSGPVVVPDAEPAHGGLAELGKMTTDQVVDAITCVICFDKPRSVVFRSCGHVCACFDCAMKTGGYMTARKCPVCRKIGMIDRFRLC